MSTNSDEYRLVNPVLRQVMKGVYNRRRSFPMKYLCDIRLERIYDQFFAQIFFMSRGCSHDLKGGCTMCNYGYGQEHLLDQEAVLKEIRYKIEQLPKRLHEVVVSPIGSMLDEEEVPHDFLIKVFDILSDIKCNEFTCETRADSISCEKLRLLKDNIRADKITLEIGVESTDDWLLRNSINKNIEFKTVQDVIETAHSMGIQICANIGIGFPFVNEAVSISSARSSIRKLLEQNVSCIALFAYNIRPGTLLEQLWRMGLYQCTSLWAIAEVLSSFSDVQLRRIQISWYRNYYEEKSKILHMPYLCDDCREDVLALFDAYRNDPCQKTLQPLLSYQCKCKDEWYAGYRMQKPEIDFLNVQNMYTALSKEFSVSAELLEKELIYMARTLSERRK